jgi:putative SOS response-associated peptidase YedK
MCGRFALGIPRKKVKERFALGEIPDTPPRYNIAPGQLVEAVIQFEDGRMLKLFKWGLVPHWAKDPAIGYKMINARAETVAEKPSFKAALRYRRCIVPAQGFFEWSHAGGKKGEPWFITSRTGAVMALAGLWEHYESPAGEIIESLAVITCQANGLVAPLHDRMPVLVEPGDDARWLDPKLTDAGQLQGVLASREWPDVQAYRVGLEVNSVKNDAPGLIEPIRG